MCFFSPSHIWKYLINMAHKVATVATSQTYLAVKMYTERLSTMKTSKLKKKCLDNKLRNKCRNNT